ncbi:hypothetical protein HBB16_07880 [Pseudonocardia sp. MCCB 268]|nr:hypothetical protein [Pseudonocardia cytotoxica]
MQRSGAGMQARKVRQRPAKLATEMQKLQQQNGANPLMGCLPILVQIQVFIGLFHVLGVQAGQDRELLLQRAGERVVRRLEPVRLEARLVLIWPLQNTASVRGTRRQLRLTSGSS